MSRAAIEDQVSRGGETGLAHPNEGLQRLLEDLGVCGALLVEDHQIDVEELQPPILEGTEQLADYVEVLDFVDPNQDYGQVARDAVGRSEERRVGKECRS